MNRYIILIISTLIFTSSTSIADTAKIKTNFFSSIESFLDSNFKDTDFSIKSTEGLKPQIGILTFKPLNDTDEGLTFFQGSFFTHDGDRETLNLGLGKRMFNEDDSAMFGLNVFYDHELDYNHQRVSIGGEIKSSILELSTNHYFGTSGEQTGKNNIKEEVADGYDLEYKSQVTIREHSYTCIVGEGELNGTNNISVTTDRSGSISVSGKDAWRLFPPGHAAAKSGSYKDFYQQATTYNNFVTHSNFTSYITKVGLYNDFNELIAIGQLSHPIKNEKELSLGINVRFDV